jgi:hypothetical protein
MQSRPDPLVSPQPSNSHNLLISLQKWLILVPTFWVNGENSQNPWVLMLQKALDVAVITSHGPKQGCFI